MTACRAFGAEKAGKGGVRPSNSDGSCSKYSRDGNNKGKKDGNYLF